MNPMRAKKLRPEDVNVFLWATKSFSTSASVRVWRCFCFRSDNFLSLHFHTVLGPAMIFVSEKDSPKVEKIAASVRDVLMRAETLFTIPLRGRLINLLSPPRTEFKRDQSDLAWRLSAWLEIYGEKRAGLTTFGNAAWGATRRKTIFLVFVFCITNRARIVRTRNTFLLQFLIASWRSRLTMSMTPTCRDRVKRSRLHLKVHQSRLQSIETTRVTFRFCDSWIIFVGKQKRMRLRCQKSSWSTHING